MNYLNSNCNVQATTNNWNCCVHSSTNIACHDNKVSYAYITYTQRSARISFAAKQLNEATETETETECCNIFKLHLINEQSQQQTEQVKNEDGQTKIEQWEIGKGKRETRNGKIKKRKVKTEGKSL